MTEKELKERLIAYRKRQGLSQAKLAKQCNLSQSTIGTIENGDYYPSMYSFFAICEGLTISPAKFFLTEQECHEIFTDSERQILDVWNGLNFEFREAGLQMLVSLKKLQDSQSEQ
jgi:transcriptional regulator with XRE-family HTH domain